MFYVNFYIAEHIILLSRRLPCVPNIGDIVDITPLRVRARVSQLTWYFNVSTVDDPPTVNVRLLRDEDR